ncbi:MAG: helix-turn-helix transcriptional regulator [Oscillospiraceae bacterium]|nr:helix-turn-helix transcriptional regulator [Oscillospiraceae bacterium]
MYKRICELRKNAGLTQKQVAQYLKMSQTGYSKYETGENNPSIGILCALADYYHVSVDYLIERTDIKIPYSKKTKNI